VKQYPSKEVDSGSDYPEIWTLRWRSEFLHPTQKIPPLDPTLQCTSTVHTLKAHFYIIRLITVLCQQLRFQGFIFG